MPEQKKSGTMTQVIKQSFPAVIDLSSQTITWLIEAIFLGQLSSLALAGVGIAQQFIVLTFSILLTFVVGSSIIIVRYLGADDQWNANHILGQAFLIGIILSVLIGLFWYFVVPLLMTLIKEEGTQARHYAITYIRTVAVFAPIIITNFICLGILRGVGDTLLTMTISLVVNVLNLVLDVFLIFGLWIFPRLETFGAGLAVGIAQTVGFIITITFLRNHKSSLFLAMMEITQPRMATFKKLFKLGIPTTIEQLVWSMGQIILSFFAAQINVTALAAHQVLVRIQSVLSMVNWGFSITGMTLVGKSIGAKDYKEALKSGHMVGRISWINAVLVGTLLFIFSRHVMSVFTGDIQVIEMGESVMLLFVILQIPKAINTAYSGNLRGCADLNWLMWLAIGAVIINEIIGAFLLTFTFSMGLAGLWLIQIFDESERLGLNIWRFNKGDWKKV
ncbi:MAG: MATE family efflux transporter [Caldisericaceae bacterium]|nr:MATE family efflux transporter [Caldisericaceae bacterium]